MTVIREKTILEGWVLEELGAFINGIGDGGTPSRNNPDNFGGSIPWVVIEDIVPQIKRTKESLTKKGLCNSSAKLWPAGSIIVSTGATIGKVGIADIPMATKQGITGIVFDRKIVFNIFFRYQLIYNKNLLIRFSQGTSFREIRPPTLIKLKFAIPPLPEQRKIAEIIKTVDNAIEETDKIIEKYKRIKQGLMQDLFTKGIDENEQIRSEETHTFKDTTLGRMPIEWEVGFITDYLEIMTDYVANGSFASLKEHVTVYDTENFAYYVRLFDLRLGLGHKNQTYVDEKSYHFLKKSFLLANDILIANIGAYVGEVWLMPSVNKPSTIAPNMLALKTNDKCIKKYLYYLLNSDIGAKEIRNVIGGSGQPKINKTELKTVKIIKMSKTEQKRIISIISRADKTIEKEQKYKEKLERIKQGLMEDLLTGKVRVNHFFKKAENVP